MNMAFPRTNPDRTQMMRGVVRSLSRVASSGNVRFRQPGRAGISLLADINTQPLARQGGGLLSFREVL
jgi:hypothetical protein